jgi:hypothetical protein
LSADDESRAEKVDVDVVGILPFLFDILLFFCCLSISFQSIDFPLLFI